MSFFPTQADIEQAYAEGVEMAESGTTPIAVQIDPMGLDPVSDAMSVGYQDGMGVIR